MSDLDVEPDAGEPVISRQHRRTLQIMEWVFVKLPLEWKRIRSLRVVDLDQALPAAELELPTLPRPAWRVRI